MGIFNSMLSRAAAGAGAGAVIGGMNGGWSGAGAGAIAGAGIAGFGGMAAKRFGGGRTVTGMMTSGLGRLGDAGMRATSTIGNRGLFNAARTADRGLARAAMYLGQNQVSVNKWGGRALMGAGVASGAYIGSSILGSNRGY